MSKSEQYNDVALKAIFRLNNNNYVLKSLQRSKLLELYTIAEPKCEQIYYDFIQKDKKAYFQRLLIFCRPLQFFLIFLHFSWNKLLSYIWSDDGPVNLMYGDKLRDKDRALIKERFAVGVTKFLHTSKLMVFVIFRVLIKKSRK